MSGARVEPETTFDLVFGPDAAEILADRRHRAAFAILGVAAVCSAVAVAASAPSRSFDPVTMWFLYTAIYAATTAWRELRRGLPLALMITALRVGMWTAGWLVFALAAAVLHLFLPDSVLLAGGGYLAAAALVVLAALMWQRDRRAQRSILGTVAGFALTLGPLIAIAAGLPVVIAVVASGCGLVLIYRSVRAFERYRGARASETP